LWFWVKLKWLRLKARRAMVRRCGVILLSNRRIQRFGVEPMAESVSFKEIVDVCNRSDAAEAVDRNGSIAV
jgi:hypothetical protein